jgi:hypothetical protein
MFARPADHLERRADANYDAFRVVFDAAKHCRYTGQFDRSFEVSIKDFAGN